MKNSRAKLFFHPVRLKIIQTLLNYQQQSVGQIAEILSDVPQATLYRQLNKLLEADVIEVVQENQIRGTIEKVYSLKQPQIHTNEELLSLSRDQHLELFLSFTTQLLNLYENYLNQGDVDLLRDGVTYRVANLFLTDEEYLDLVKKMSTLLQQAMLNKPTPERREINIATIVIPEKPKQ
jgi:DNA-binding transcriptional ArsR family regulator